VSLSLSVPSLVLVQAEFVQIHWLCDLIQPTVPRELRLPSSLAAQSEICSNHKAHLVLASGKHFKVPWAGTGSLHASSPLNQGTHPPEKQLLFIF